MLPKQMGGYIPAVAVSDLVPGGFSQPVEALDLDVSLLLLTKEVR